VDVVEVFANDVLGMPVIVPLEHQVTAGSHADLVRDVAWQNELPVAPLDLNLPAESAIISSDAVATVAHPLVSDVQIMPADVVVKPLGILRFEKGNCGRALMVPQENIQ
jgi:hypothetical protein